MKADSDPSPLSLFLLPGGQVKGNKQQKQMASKCSLVQGESQCHCERSPFVTNVARAGCPKELTLAPRIVPIVRARGSRKPAQPPISFAGIVANRTHIPLEAQRLCAFGARSSTSTSTRITVSRGKGSPLRRSSSRRSWEQYSWGGLSTCHRKVH